MHELYELKEMLCKELEEYGSKGELTAGSLDVIDKLAHTLKNLDKIIEAKNEEEEYSMAGGSYAGGSYQGGNMGGGSSNRGGSYARRGSSYARGGRGGRNNNPTGRNQYSRAYSYADGMEELISEMKEMMGELPEEKRREVQRFVEKMERM